MNTSKPLIKYKKAPQAPKRFKSSYMFFSTVKHKEIRTELIANSKEEGERIKTTDVAKLVSKVWNTLPEDEREKWDELAKRDRVRYEKEKLAYTGPWKVPVQVTNAKMRRVQPQQTKYKIPKPQHPLSAFLSFSNSKRLYVKNKHKYATTTEILSILAHMWREADPNEKKLFLDEQLRLEQNYNQTMIEWEKSRSSKNSVVARTSNKPISITTSSMGNNTNSSAYWLEKLRSSKNSVATRTSNKPISITISSMGNNTNSSAYCTDMAATIFDDLSPHSTLSTCMNSSNASSVAGAVAGPTSSSTEYNREYAPYNQEQRQYQQQQHQQPQHYPHYDHAAAFNYRNPYGDTHPSSYGYQLPMLLSSTITNAANHTSYERGYNSRESQQHSYGYSVHAQPYDHHQAQKPVSVILEYPQQQQELQQQQPSLKQNDVSAYTGGNNNNNETPYYHSYSCDLNSSFPPVGGFGTNIL